MKWFKPKLKTKNVIEFSQLLQQKDKILSENEKSLLKGGVNSKERIWLGCGGIIPQ